MSSQEWASEAWELLPPGTRPERDSSAFVLNDADCCKIWSFFKKALHNRAIRCCCWGLLVVIGIFKLRSLAQKADDAFFQVHGVSSLQSSDILENEFPLLSYWTAYNSIPVTCHSHNGRGRHFSLQSAISSRCMSIEMKLFPAENGLLIGPNPHMLSRAINLRALYIDPLLGLIREYNQKLETSASRAHPSKDGLSGVFPGDPTQSLVLLMNFDADPERVWSQLILQLEPLRDAGFLSYFNGSAVVQGPITIVATGKVPFHRIMERSTFRDVFFDAPLLQLMPFHGQVSPQNSDYSAHNSYYASADFRTAIGDVDFDGFSDKQLANVRQQIQVAHGLGLKVRYVGTPAWLPDLRNHVWRILHREGVDIITVDESRNSHQRNIQSRNE